VEELAQACGISPSAWRRDGEWFYKVVSRVFMQTDSEPRSGRGTRGPIGGLTMTLWCA